jgi:hypothetical protein
MGMIVFRSLILYAALAVCIDPAIVRAANYNSSTLVSDIMKRDSGTKSGVAGIKRKIAEEREAILSAGRRLTDARKSKDKALIDQVKKEVDAEIAGRKAAINALKDEMAKLQGGGEFAPRSQSRSGEAP